MYGFFLITISFLFMTFPVYAEGTSDISIGLLVSAQDENKIYIAFTNSSSKEKEILLCDNALNIIANCLIEVYDQKNTLLFSRLPDNQTKTSQDLRILLPEGTSIAIPISINDIINKKTDDGNYRIRISYGHFDIEGKFITQYSSKFISYCVRNKKNNHETERISPEEAKTIALKANPLKYDKSQEVEISLADDIYIVTFPSPPLPPDSTGPDFSAKIKIDAKTGKVLSIMAGS